MRERSNIELVIADSPGLKPKPQELFKAAYTQARNRAAKETRLDIRIFPVDPPFTREQVEDDDFWPTTKP